MVHGQTQFGFCGLKVGKKPKSEICLFKKNKMIRTELKDNHKIDYIVNTLHKFCIETSAATFLFSPSNLPNERHS